jgi:hypothetical protein
MGVDTVEKTAISTRLRHSSASWRPIWEAEDRDPVVMQAIETVTAVQGVAEVWVYSSKEITEAIYDEIRRLDRERLANRFEDLAAKTDGLGVLTVSPHDDR